MEWVLNHDRELARFLLDQGAQKTIHLACGLGDVDMVRELLDQDPSLVNFVPSLPHMGAGFTPLHAAAIWTGTCYVDIIRLLVERGADLKARSAPHPYNQTVLELAQGYGNEEIIRVLKELEAKEQRFPLSKRVFLFSRTYVFYLPQGFVNFLRARPGVAML